MISTPLYVKICGVTAPEHALAAAEEGADFVGLMFARESRRYLTLERAQTIASELRAAFPAPSGPKLVGVFVNEDPAAIRRIVEALNLDLVQLSGDEPWEVLYGLPRPAFKAFRVPDGVSPSAVASALEQARPALEVTHSICLLDAAVAGAHGGTGQRLDWSVAAYLARQMPVLLAGGLTPDNVADAVVQVQPWGVDVSSGVETGGVKDVTKIRAFIRAVREVGALVERTSALDVNTVLKMMLQKLIMEYQPEKVILFGSYAYGTPEADSDIDLLIIKETAERFIDRWVRVRRILAGTHHTVPVDTLILTPHELEHRLAIRDQVIVEIIHKGRVLYAA